MIAVFPPGDPARTIVAGKAQGWNGLPVNYHMTDDANNGGPFPAMTTAWEPTPDELGRLKAGAKVVIQIIGIPPINPMAVYVGDIPDDDLSLDAAPVIA